MTVWKPKGGLAVVSDRMPRIAGDLDFFPTPLWASRALFEHVIPLPIVRQMTGQVVWEPAAGAGHMAEVLTEYFGPTNVRASDIRDYGYPLDQVSTFPDSDIEYDCDWIITNPPFNGALDFTLRALQIAKKGVAMLVRTQWLESRGRYQGLFADKPPTIVGLFVERVPMTKGRWNPKASTMTSYAWMVWLQDPDVFVFNADGEQMELPTMLLWIPPGQRKELTKITDMRFAA